MKKKLPIIVGVIVFLLLVGVFFWWRGKKQAELKALPTPTPEGVLVETPLAERPFVALIPRTDGREFTLEITGIKNAETVEYELVYLTHGLSRGVVGSVELEGESQLSRKLLLGTCSRGVCKYDEDVTEGTLTVRFRGPGGVRKFVSDFHLQEDGRALTSIDGRFQLEGKLSSSAFYLTMPTVGLPAAIEGEVLAGPYGIFTAGSERVKNGRLVLTLTEAVPAVKVYRWTGRQWQAVEGGLKVDGQKITVETDSLGTFVVVASE